MCASVAYWYRQRITTLVMPLGHQLMIEIMIMIQSTQCNVSMLKKVSR